MAEKQESATALSTETATSPRESNGPKAIIKNVDMSEEMQQESVDITSAALEKYNIEKDIAAQIKKELDRRHGPTWHVVVGKNFGSYVTHGKPLPSLRVFRFNPAQPPCLPAILHLSMRKNPAGHILKSLDADILPM